MNSFSKNIVMLAFMLLEIPCLFSQIKDIGIPNLTNYSRKQYNASTQNWSICQDSRGVMYFANNDGLLSFDGSFWNLFKLKNNSIVRAVAAGPEGKIYVGSFNEFGYFFPTSNGEMAYHSLSDSIKGGNANFGEIWKIIVTKTGIYFQSFSDIFVLRNGTVKNLFSDKNFRYLFHTQGKLYIAGSNGVFEIENDSLIYINGSNIFSDKEIWTILPFSNDGLLVGTSDDGLFTYYNSTFEYWDNDVSGFCKRNQIFCGTSLIDNHYAIGSIQDGVIVFDNTGKILQHLNKGIGLQNNTILSIYNDFDNNIWLGLDNGVDYAKISSPVTFFVKKKEIGAGYASIIHNGKIYLGTNQGLFYKSFGTNASSPSKGIRMVKGTKGQVWSLTKIDGKLYCGHNKGAFLIDEATSNLLFPHQGVWGFIQVPSRQELVVAGTYNSLLLFEKSLHGLKLKQVIDNFSESSREMVFENNTLWMSHGLKGVYKIHFNIDFTSVSAYKLYGEKNGFPSSLDITVHKFKNNILFSTSNGFYTYNSEKDTFLHSKHFSGLFGKTKVNKKLYEDNSGNIWFFQDNELKISRLNYEGTYTTKKLPFIELKNTFIYSFEDLYIHDNSNIFVCTEEGFIHFDPTVIQYQKPSLKVFIRHISTARDSLIFGGNFKGADGKIRDTRPPMQINFIDYGSNDLHFQYSSPDYTGSGTTLYQIFLQGYDKDWSDYSQNTSKEYTNLSEGSYIFNVRSKNIQGEISPVSTFEFIVYPPWYRSTFAYILYGVLALFALYLISKYYLKQFEEEKQQLERKQKEELEKQRQRHKEKAILAEQEIVKLKNEKLELEIERKKNELENKSKELATIAMQITYKNEILEQIKAKLTKVANKMIHEDSKNQVEGLIKTIQKEMHKEEDWEKFEVHFDQVHENFIHNLKNKYPELTPKDLKLAAYLRMNLSTKEIAPLLNISIRGVEISRYRMRKKLHLSRDTNITEFLLGL